MTKPTTITQPATALLATMMSTFRHPVARGRRALVLALGALVAASLASGGGQAQERTQTIKLATATLNDAQHEWMKRFAVMIGRNTGGRIKAELYPASQLGSIPRMIEGTQLGSIQIWVGPPEFLVGVDQRFELLSAPGVFDNEAHGLRTIADPDFAKAFLAIGANKGLVGAALFFTGPMGFDMRAPMRSLADLKGKKIRVLASPFQTEQLTRLGATGVPMSLGDVLPALQQGTLDGAMGSLPVFGAMQYQETAKFMTEAGQSHIFSIAMLSRRWFDALPADLKEQVMATARAAAAEAIPWSLDFIASQRKVWTQKGGEVIFPPAAERADMMAKLASVGDDIVKTRPDLKPLWELMVATAKKTK